MWIRTQLLLTVVSLLVAGAAVADTPIIVYRSGLYSLDIQVTVDGELICDEDINVLEDVGGVTTICNVDLSEASELHVAGSIKSADDTGQFNDTFPLIDFDPFSEMLRDETLDFGARLDQHYENLLAVDPDISNVISVDHTDVTEAAVAQVLGADTMVAMPSEMEALITRHIRFFEDAYISPNSGNRARIPPRWPNLTEIELGNGRPESDLPEFGSALRDWYDRVLVVYEIWDGKQITVVWDPEATATDPAFFWHDGNTHEVSPFLYPDATPISALEVLLIPYETAVFYYLNNKSSTWHREAIRTRDATDLDATSKFHIFASSTPNIEMQLSFAQQSRVPFFRTVKPEIYFFLPTWWDLDNPN
jgi:hypothetical protein